MRNLKPEFTNQKSQIVIPKSNNFTQCYTFLAAPFSQDVMMSKPKPITHCMMSLQNHIWTLAQEFQFLTETTVKTRPFLDWIATGNPVTRHSFVAQYMSQIGFFKLPTKTLNLHLLSNFQIFVTLVGTLT